VADDGFGGIDDVHEAAVGAQVDQVQDALGFGDGQLQTAQGISTPPGWGDGDGQAVFGGVVDDRADAPDAAGGGFEFRKVGLPDPVALGGRITEYFAAQHCPGLAVGPKALRQKQSAPP
jgi:hypothetical protein